MKKRVKKRSVASLANEVSDLQLINQRLHAEIALLKQKLGRWEGQSARAREAVKELVMIHLRDPRDA